MTSFLNRRQVLVGAALSALSAPTVLRAQDTQIIRVGALKLIHSIGPYFYEQFTPAGYKVEVYPFESPTEGKNAVVTKSVDFGMFGVAAALLGAAAGEPISVIAGACNKGMAIIAGKDTPISSIKDLKGKRSRFGPAPHKRCFFSKDSGWRDSLSRISHLFACPLVKCTSRWLEVISMHIQARNLVPELVFRRVSESWLSIPTAHQWEDSIWSSVLITTPLPATRSLQKSCWIFTVRRSTM